RNRAAAGNELLPELGCLRQNGRASGALNRVGDGQAFFVGRSQQVLRTDLAGVAANEPLADLNRPVVMRNGLDRLPASKLDVAEDFRVGGAGLLSFSERASCAHSPGPQIIEGAVEVAVAARQLGPW